MDAEWVLKLQNVRKWRTQKNNQKPWETLIISENLTWEEFSKINYFLHELVGAKPVLSVSRDYPFKENYTHILGYVSQANDEDILLNENIKEKLRNNNASQKGQKYLHLHPQGAGRGKNSSRALGYTPKFVTMLVAESIARDKKICIGTVSRTNSD